MESLKWLGGDLSDASEPKDKGVQLSELSVDMPGAIGAVFSGQPDRVTKVYWPSEDLFRPGKDSEEKPGEPASEEDAEGEEEGEEAP